MFQLHVLCYIWIIVCSVYVNLVDSSVSECVVHMKVLPNRLITLVNGEELCECLGYEPSSTTKMEDFKCDIKSVNSDGKLGFGAADLCKCAGYQLNVSSLTMSHYEANVTLETNSTYDSILRSESVIMYDNTSLYSITTTEVPDEVAYRSEYAEGTLLPYDNDHNETETLPTSTVTSNGTSDIDENLYSNEFVTEDIFTPYVNNTIENTTTGNISIFQEVLPHYDDETASEEGSGNHNYNIQYDLYDTMYKHIETTAGNSNNWDEEKVNNTNGSREINASDSVLKHINEYLPKERNFSDWIAMTTTENIHNQADISTRIPQLAEKTSVSAPLAALIAIACLLIISIIFLLLYLYLWFSKKGSYTLHRENNNMEMGTLFRRTQ